MYEFVFDVFRKMFLFGYILVFVLVFIVGGVMVCRYFDMYFLVLLLVYVVFIGLL